VLGIAESPGTVCLTYQFGGRFAQSRALTHAGRFGIIVVSNVNTQ
jgi:hypothetical protein